MATYLCRTGFKEMSTSRDIRNRVTLAHVAYCGMRTVAILSVITTWT